MSYRYLSEREFNFNFNDNQTTPTKKLNYSLWVG